VDPVDEMLVQWLPEFEGKKLKSIGKGAADLGEEENLKEKEREFSNLTSALQKKLDDRAKEVRLSGRLTSSPACLVVSEGDVSPHLEKLLNQVKGETTKQKRIMELNPNHEIITRMRDRAQREDLLDFVGQVSPRAVLLGHGDENSRKWFEDQIRSRHPKIKIIQPQPGKAVEV